MFIDVEQKYPVKVSQSLLPQAQSTEFSADPSVIVHAANLEHLPTDAEQYRPVDSSQSVEPQEQSMEFAALPSSIVHAATLEHLLLNKEQKYPVDAWQSIVPHVQSALLTDKPLPMAQAFDDVIVIVLPCQPLLVHTDMDVGLGENSGRGTSSRQ